MLLFYRLPLTVCFTLGKCSKQQVTFAKFKAEKLLAPAFPGVICVDTAVSGTTDRLPFCSGLEPTTTADKRACLRADSIYDRGMDTTEEDFHAVIHELEWVRNRNLIILDGTFL